MTAVTSPPSPIDEFVRRLETRAREDDRAPLARLRRCAGRPLAECPEVYDIFYDLLPPLLRHDDRRAASYFLVATLFAGVSSRSLAPAQRGTIGRALSAVAADPKNAESAGRRLAILLDADVDDLPFRLRQTVAWLTAHDIAVDWRRLLNDLLWWSHPNHRVQRDWAREFYGAVRRGDDGPSDDTLPDVADGSTDAGDD